jgi:hypothetical protein
MNYETQSVPLASSASQEGEEQALQPLHDVLAYLRQYAREKPEIVALTCLGLGFILGWKLKPW